VGREKIGAVANFLLDQEVLGEWNDVEAIPHAPPAVPVESPVFER
jgi:hypothetical protein